MNGNHGTEPVVVLLGAGIMIATSAVFLKEVDPSLRMVESLDAAIDRSGVCWLLPADDWSAFLGLKLLPRKGALCDKSLLS
jgi:hypothetical protein